MMGRGLSPLQEWVLVRALDAPDRSELGGCDLKLKRVLVEFYGIEGTLGRWARRFRGMAVVAEAKLHRPAVSRAFTRLEQRGLVSVMCGACSRWTGINLTEAGRERATTIRQRRSADTSSVVLQRQS